MTALKRTLMRVVLAAASLLAIGPATAGPDPSPGALEAMAYGAYGVVETPPRPGFYPGYENLKDEAESRADFYAYRARIRPDTQRLDALIADLRAQPDARGCLGKDQWTCVATLAQRLAVMTGIPYSGEHDGPFENERTDTKGDSYYADADSEVWETNYLVGLDGKSHNQSGFPTFVEMTVRRGGAVSGIHIPLYGDVLKAATPREFEATQAWMLTRMAAPASCDIGTPDVFQAFVRGLPRVHRRLGEERNADIQPHSVQVDYSIATGTLCGQPFMAATQISKDSDGGVTEIYWIGMGERQETYEWVQLAQQP